MATRNDGFTAVRAECDADYLAQHYCWACSFQFTHRRRVSSASAGRFRPRRTSLGRAILRAKPRSSKIPPNDFTEEPDGQAILLLLHDECRQIDVALAGGSQLCRARHADDALHGAAR